jgi:hypothetical protein
LHHAVDVLDHEEQRKSNDQEIDDRVDEGPETDHRCPGFLGRAVGRIFLT